MRLRHRVALNGIQLDELDPDVLVLGVAEEAAVLGAPVSHSPPPRP